VQSGIRSIITAVPTIDDAVQAAVDRAEKLR
jgi:hypothetical protein